MGITRAGAYSYTLVIIEVDIGEGQYMACISGVDVVYSVSSCMYAVLQV